MRTTAHRPFTEAEDSRRSDRDVGTGAAPAEPSQARLLALQRGAGNHAIARLLARAPAPGTVDLDPGRFLEKHPELVEGQPKTERKQPGHAHRSDATSWDSQPEALREVLERSWGEAAFSHFSALSDTARQNLVYTYNRMISYGIWGHVRQVTKLEAGEAPVELGPLTLYVAGKSQSVAFEVYDREALLDTMLRGGKFGKDTGVFGLLHPGQVSMREWSVGDGLHLSIGDSTKADAHIDTKSPTNRPRRQEGQFDFVRSIEHHWQEVWPEFIRALPGWLARVPQHVYEWLVDKLKYLGAGERFREALKAIPRPLFIAAAKAADLLDALGLAAGITFKPGQKIEHPDPTQREKSSDIVVVKEFRFGEGGKEARRPAEAPPGESSMEEDLAAAVDRAVAAALPGLLKPTGGRLARGDYADTETVGRAMARKITYQAKAHGQTITIDLGPVYHSLTKPEVADVKQQLATVGKAARESLAAALTARKDDDLAEAVLAVKSGTTQLGPSPVWFALH